MIIFFSSPDGSQYPFGLAFSPKDMAYSGREAVLKNNCFAPKKNTSLSVSVSIIYHGAKDVPTLQETGRFVRITSSGITESHPHNVTITKEAPNYSR